jgi:hypothetical protein
MNIFVGVFTPKTDTERRQTCLDTWFRQLQRPNIRSIFLIGDDVPEPVLSGSNLRINCKDDRASLAFKTKGFCRWALRYDFDYLFKCDDDTFIATDRFVEFDPEGKDYIGFDFCNVQNPKCANRGAGTWLSRRAVGVIAEMNVNQMASDAQTAAFNEDIIVYHALKQNGIKLSNDRRFQPGNQLCHHPSASNEIITCHHIQPADMRRLDQKMADIRRGCQYDNMDRGNHKRFNHIYSKRLQVDWMGGWGKNDGPVLIQESLCVIGEDPHNEAIRRDKLTLTYLRQLDGYLKFHFMPPAYDWDYVPLVKAKDPLNRNPNACYVWGRKNYGYKSGRLFDRADFVDIYKYRYELERMTGIVSINQTGPLAYDKIAMQNNYKFTVACENMIADGWWTEKILDCVVSDSVPIFIGGKLPDYLEECVCRIDDLDTEKTAKQIGRFLSMSDAEYMVKLSALRNLRFGHKLYQQFSYQTLFNKAQLSIDTRRIRSDGSDASR